MAGNFGTVLKTIGELLEPAEILPTDVLEINIAPFNGRWGVEIKFETVEEAVRFRAQAQNSVLLEKNTVSCLLAAS